MNSCSECPTLELRELYDLANEIVKYIAPSSILLTLCGKMHYVPIRYLVSKKENVYIATCEVLEHNIHASGTGTSTALAKRKVSINALSKILSIASEKNELMKILVPLLPSTLILAKRTKSDEPVKILDNKHTCHICENILKTRISAKRIIEKCKIAVEILQSFEQYEKSGLYKLRLVGSFTLSCQRNTCRA